MRNCLGEWQLILKCFQIFFERVNFVGEMRAAPWPLESTKLDGKLIFHKRACDSLLHFVDDLFEAPMSSFHYGNDE